MRLKQLESLIALQESNGLAGAAEKMCISVPALTKSMLSLEEEIGVPLFNRDGYRVVLNEAGNCIAEYAKSILSEVEDAKSQAHKIHYGKDGKLRIHAGPALIADFIPAVNCKFAEVHPSVSVDIHHVYLSGKTVTIFNDLKSGVLDLSISPMRDTELLEGLEWEPLLRMQLKLVVRAGHPAASLQDTSIDSLSQYQWLIPSTGGAPHAEVARVFRELSTKDMSLYNTSSVPFRDTVLKMLKRSDFVALLPCNDQLFQLDPNDYTVIDIGNFGWMNFLLKRKSLVENPILSKYIETLKSVLGENDLTK